MQPPRTYTQGIKLRLDDPEPIRRRGDLYTALGRYRDAIEDYDQSIRLKADNPEALLARGFVGANSASTSVPSRTSIACSR